LESSDSDRKIILKLDLKTGWEFANWTNLIQVADVCVPRGKNPFCSLRRTLCGPQNWSGRYAKGKNLSLFRESHTGHPARSS